jgi:hypothetical protein
MREACECGSLAEMTDAALIRLLNLGLRPLNERFASATHDWIVVCECGDLACFRPVHLTREDFDEIRSSDGAFIVSPDCSEAWRGELRECYVVVHAAAT